MIKPYSESCDRNRNPILAVIQPLLLGKRAVLEIGSGTGQHAVAFAAKLRHLIWYTSDRDENLPGIKLWIDEAELANIRDPIVLDVAQWPWPDISADAVFSANTAHIMHWPEVEAMISGVARILPDSGLFLLYGPFNYNGRFTSDSNARFDAWLRARDGQSGIRDFNELSHLASRAQLFLKCDVEMPANNRLLCWEKRTGRLQNEMTSP